nr:nitrous oxide reductase accessory protein NosL [Bacteroidia bacterium]
LIGFKQLLNFGAYSIPDIGGWLFIASGLLMLTAVIYEFRFAKIKVSKMQVLVPGMMAILLLASCGNVEKEPIALNKEHCDNCQMVISDPRFAAELITTKGRIYKFDDITCMKSFINSKKGDYRSYFISDYLPPHGLHNVKEMIFIQGTGIKAPMGGTVAAFSDEASALKYSEQLSAKIISYDTLMN